MLNITSLVWILSFLRLVKAQFSYATVVYTNESACGRCWNAFNMSAAFVVKQWSITNATISTGLATTTTHTLNIGFMTLDNSNVLSAAAGLATNWLYAEWKDLYFWTTLPMVSTETIWANFTGSSISKVYTSITGEKQLSDMSVLSIASVLMDSEYTSFQELWSAGGCITRWKFFNISAPAVFTDGNFVTVTMPMETQAAITAFQDALGPLICTRSTSIAPNTRTGLPTARLASYIPATDIDNFYEYHGVSETAQVGFGIMIGAGAALILGFLGFFLWKRRFTIADNDNTKRNARRKKVRPNLKSHSSAIHLSSQSKIKSASQPSALTKWTIQWRAPLIMLGGIIMGVALSIGHHGLYRYLAGQPIDDVYLSQSWIIRFGTLIAFLVKVNFAITISTAYAQLQWLKTRETSLRVKDIDTISSVLNNILSFAHKIWLHLPSLAMLATASWLLFLLPVLAPGTLNVDSIAHEETVSLSVPRLRLDVGSTWGLDGINDFTSDTGTASIYPTIDLAEVYIPTAYEGQIRTMSSDILNQTFQLNFYGPAINCSRANESVVFDTTMKDGTQFAAREDVNGAIPDNSGEGSTLFEAWAPGGGGNIDYLSRDTAKLFLMFNDFGRLKKQTWIRDNLPVNGAPNITVNGSNLWLVNVTECALYNASYKVNFTFRNGVQYVQPLKVDWINGVAINITLATMAGGEHYYNAIKTNITLQSPEANAKFAYLSLMAGFNSLMIGNILLVGRNGQADSVVNTKIQYFPKIMQGNTEDTLEELFRNMTISVLTSRNPSLTSNDTVMGTITVYRITYKYNPFDLVLIYSVALLLTLLCCAIGFYSFVVNGASYQNVFSTFIRATKNSALPVEDGDTGAEPRPKVLAHTLVHLTMYPSDVVIPATAAEEPPVAKVPIPPRHRNRRQQNQSD